MVKKQDIERLFYELQALDSTDGGGTLVGVAIEKGEVQMKMRVLEIVRAFYYNL